MRIPKKPRIVRASRKKPLTRYRAKPGLVMRDDKGLLLPGSQLGTGQPVGWRSWKSIISEVLSEKDLRGVTLKEKIIRRISVLAVAGVPWASEFMADREEGRAAQPLTGANGAPLNPAAGRLDVSALDTASLRKLAKLI